MEIKELLLALKDEGLTDEEIVKVLDQKLADGEITQEDYDWAINELKKQLDEDERKEALKLLGVKE